MQESKMLGTNGAMYTNLDSEMFHTSAIVLQQYS